MAIPLLRGIGATVSDPAPVTPPFPAATAVNDILILIAGSASPVANPLEIADFGGGIWTRTGADAPGNGSRLATFWSRYNGTQTPPTTNDTGDHQSAVILGYIGCPTTGSPINVEIPTAPTFAETTSTFPSVTTTVANCLILDVINGELPDLDGTNVFNYTNNGLANFAEILDFSSSVGSGGSIGVATGGKATFGATGTTTVSHASFRVVFKKIALIGTSGVPATGFGTDTSVTPPRATKDGVTFFPRIAYDSGESSNFSDISVAALNLGQYEFTDYLNYQFGPFSKVLPQTTPLVPLGMVAQATGNSVTTFPALLIPTTAPTPTSGAAGNVDVGTHSYKVTFTILSGAQTYPNMTISLGATTGTGITVTATVGTPFLRSDMGRQIWASNGRASIVGFTSSTVVTVDILVAFSTTVFINDPSNQTRWQVVGVQTNVGPTSSIVTVATSPKQITLTNIPIGIPGTVHRKIYRTVAGDAGAYKFVMTIMDNTTTTVIDNVADAILNSDASNAPGFSVPFAITENTDLIAGVPFRTHWDTRPGAGAFYVTDEPQASSYNPATKSGFGLPENVLYWRGVAEAQMPHIPRFMALFPEGPLSPETFAGSGIQDQFGSVGFTEHLQSVANPYFWCRLLPFGGNDWIGDDIYVNFHNENLPGTSGGVQDQGGFPRFLVADRAAFSTAAAAETQKVPVLTIQLFGPFQQGRFPNVTEMWADVIMAVAEGIRGIAWWQIGTNLGLRDQTEPTKTNANNALIAITQFLATNEQAILSTPITAGWTNSTRSGTPLAWRIGILPTVANGCRHTSFTCGGRALYQAELNALNAGVTAWSPMLDQNGNVRQRVFNKTQLSYLVFAYNYHPSPAGSVTLTAPAPIQSVTVIGEARTITPSGATFVDTFGGSSSLLQGPSWPAHIYEVTLVGGSIPIAGGAALTGGAAGRVMGTLLRPGSLVGG